jgi:hypothetical protein
MAFVRHRGLCRRGFQLAQVSLHRLEQLTDLVGLRLPFVVLHVHARIAGPRHLPNSVAGSVLRRRAEEIVGDLAGVGEPNASGVLLHLSKEFVDARSHRHNGAIIGTTSQVAERAQALGAASRLAYFARLNESVRFRRRRRWRRA